MAPTRISRFGRNTVQDIVQHHPRLGAALCWSAMQEAAMLRERIVSLGRANARARIAYLFCEFFWRYHAIGLTEDQEFRLPLTQADIADALGLTSVHVNRVVQALRKDGLITLGHRHLSVHHLDQLHTLAGTERDYLHFDQCPAEIERSLDRVERRAS